MKSNTNLLINNNDNNKQSIQINNKFNNPILENNAERIQELLESKKFVNSMKSIQESNLLNYDEIKLLPALFFDMQEALKKSNENILELRDSIKDKINIEKKLKNKIKEYEKEIKLLDEIIYKYYFVEFEDKRKLDSNILFNLTNNKKEIINNLEDFISNLKLNEDEILLVTGSLHFASNFKKIYNLINNK
jgi:folylpolyglutamate synthase/dihydropteroate synthase